MTILERLSEIGIRRVGSPKRGFRYRTAEGKRASTVDRERIDALRIPPAWQEVFVHPSASAAVQAIGRDAAGRWQYLYHERQILKREQRKLERLRRFIRALPDLRRTVARDLALPGLPRERVLAGMVRLLETCFLRPGSEAYASENGSFGLTTLRPRHVRVRGATIAFDFVGKSGKRHVREVREPRVARLIRELLRMPGEVFKFRGEDGSVVDVKSRHVNQYLRDAMGERFTAKDFRTWAGTLLAACALGRTGPDSRESKSARKKAVAAAMREVADHLGNTPAVARASYVFPVVVKRFESGRVLRRPLAGLPCAPRSLARCERELLSLLAG